MAKKKSKKEKKENKNGKQSQKSAPPTSSKSSYSMISKLLLIIAVLMGLFSYYVYKVLISPPAQPKLNLNQWWGHYPIDPVTDESIRPFEIEFSDVIVNDLRERLLHRRPFTPPLEDSGFTYGFNTNYLTQVLDYWQNKYNFKDRENFFNKYNHFKTKIQGLDVHYVHVKPKVTADITVVPLLLLHGWPGSFREFYEIIPKLTTHRTSHKIVFEVIVPSLPGFGYSEGAARPGFGPVEMAVVIRNLMKRIGIAKYYIHGGDVGHTIGSTIATLFPENVLGFHSSFPVVLFSPLASMYMFLGSLWPSLIAEPGLESRVYSVGELFTKQMEESGYMHIQATKPDTIGAALTDTPAGLAAYILEKFSTWTNEEYKKASDGRLTERYQLTHLIDNVMVYWTSNSITTSCRLHAETYNKRNMDLKLDDIPTYVPAWGIKFKNDVLYHPDFVLRIKYKNYLHTTIVEDGGHFAAMELPDVLADDIFMAVSTFKEFHTQAQQHTPPAKTTKTIYQFTVKDLNGKEVKLDKYKGYVLLIVNVASQCGLTDTNYKQLNELYDKYESKGLRILAFPCNQFGGQEPGSREDIFRFTQNRGVKFDLFEKVDVNGENTHPLWQFLKEAQGGMLGDFIKWNFSKFIVDRNGVPVERFAPNVNPLDLEQSLAKYW